MYSGLSTEGEPVLTGEGREVSLSWAADEALKHTKPEPGLAAEIARAEKGRKTEGELEMGKVERDGAGEEKRMGKEGIQRNRVGTSAGSVG